MTDTSATRQATLHLLLPLPYADVALGPVVATAMLGYRYGLSFKAIDAFQIGRNG